MKVARLGKVLARFSHSHHPQASRCANATASYFTWRHFFPAFDPEAREMIRATWRVTSPNERPVADDFSCLELRPTQLEVVFSGPRFVVHQYDPTVERRDAKPRRRHLGAEGFAAALRGLVGSNTAGAVRTAFKVIRVTSENGHLATTVLVEIGVPAENPTRQINSRWICEWTRSVPPSTDPPLLRSIRVEQFEEVTLVNSSGTLFADCTQAALGSLACYGKQYLHGNNYWAERISVLEASSLLGNYGLAVGDVNGDGLEDLYVCDGGGLPNRLLLQQDDGDLDIFVCSYESPHRAAGFRSRGFASGAPIPYNDANNGSPNALLENRGKFRFLNVTDKVGLGANNNRFSYAAAWEDYDNDGDQDLYVANDYGRNNLYRNDDGRFVDVTQAAGVEDMASGMSVSWADANRDGRMDLYVGNMFSAAGNRVTFQRKFTRSRDDAKAIQRTARGNTLFAGRDDGRFDDVSEAAGVTMGRWAWSSRFADLNNDGWPDLIVANGFLTNRRNDDL